MTGSHLKDNRKNAPKTFRVVIATAGTAQKIATTPTPCRRVWVQANSGNSGDGICVGDENVVATEATRRGKFFFNGQGDWHDVDDVSKLYVDVLDSGDQAHGYYEE